VFEITDVFDHSKVKENKIEYILVMDWMKTVKILE